MARLIVLRLIGNLEAQGYQVTLEISEEGKRADAEETGFLPAHGALADKIAAHWRDKYRNLVAPYRRKTWVADDDISQSATTEFTTRIKPKKISYDGSVNARIRECKASADELEALFLRWLDSEGFRPIDKCLRNNLNRAEATRFLIRAEDPQLQKLPWHAWDLFRVFESEPAFSPPRLQAVSKVPASEDKRSVKILAILGHSAGINVEEDRTLLKKLAPDTHFLVEPDLKAITDQLWEQPWDIIFFAGHSETEGETGKIYINPEEYLTLDDLWYGLRKAVENGLQVAIFNSCDGLGLAQRLINDFQIPNLIVMRELVPDLVAQEFLKYFLSAFAGGRPFHLAAREARERLQSLEGNYPCASWLPTIYQNPLEAALYWRDLTAPEETADEEEATPADKTPKRRIPIFRRPTLREVRRATATSLLVTSLVMGVRWLGVLEPVELMAYDHLMRMRPEETRDPNILIVEITPEDTEEYGYPLSDSQLASVLDTIQASEPLAIGLTLQRRQQRGTDEERNALINQFKENKNLISMCSSEPQTDELHGAPDELSPDEKVFQVGFGDLEIDSDLSGQVVRRQLLSYQPELTAKNSTCISGYSFALLLANQFLIEQGTEAKTVESPKSRSNPVDWAFGGVTLKSISSRFGGYQSLFKGQEHILLNYRNISGAPAQTITLQELVDGEVESKTIENRIVLVGHNNPFLYPSVPTPLGSQPEIHVHAHAISNLITLSQGKRHQMRAFSQAVDMLFVLTSVLLGAILILPFKKAYPLYIFVIGVIYLSMLYLTCHVLFLQGIWMPLLPILVASLSIIAISQFDRFSAS